MATGNSTLRAFNSLGGFSVKDDPQVVIIDANGNVTTNVLVVNNSANLGNVGNVYIGGGSEGQVLQTDGNGNLTWSSSANVNQIHNGNSNVTIPDVSGNVYINANAGVDRQWNFDTTGNTTFPAIGVVSLGNLATANYVNVTNQINGNIANFTGNLTALNANLGNLATANYVNVANDINVASGNITLTSGYANIGGNLTAANANLGNLATANFVNVSSNLQVSNVGITGNITGNLIPAANVTYNLGNATNAWKDLYLSGTTIYIGSQNISSNATSIAVSNDFAANNLFATNNVSANGNVYANAGGGKGYIYANFANVESNLFVGGNANVAGTTKTYQEQLTSLTSTQVVYGNGSSFLVGSANFVFSDITNTLSVDNANLIGTLNGNIANFSGNLTSLNANLGNLATANYVNVAANLVVSGNANFTSAANVALGSVSNVHITGGTSGYVLTTDGSGGLSWSATAATNEIQNGTSNVWIEDPNGNVTITAGSNTWTFTTGGTLYTAGDIQANGTVNANYITAAFDVTATGNVVGNIVNANYVNINNDLQVNNNANIGNTLFANIANITTLNTANANISGNLSVDNLTVNLDSNLNTANFSGQVYLNNSANVTGNLGVAGNITTSGAGGNITMSGGNINGANVIFANTANISLQLNGANANFTGNVTAGNFIGTLANGTSNVRIDNGGNITFSPGSSYGNAVTISPNGITTIGNVSANGNITSNTGVVSNSVTAFGDTTLTLSAGASTGGDYNVSLVPTGPNGVVNVNSTRITNLATPNAASDAATKQYVDDVAQGLNIHQAAYAGTVTTLAVATGGTVSYTAGPNGAVPGVGAYLTTTGTFHFIDGANVQTVGTRILVKNEANAAWNGVYTYSTTTKIIRATDEDQNADFDGGDFLFITAGDTIADTGWVQTTNNVIVGTSDIVFVQFSAAGTYSANTQAGLILNGTVFSAKVDDITTAFDSGGNIVVKASANLTTPNIGAATGTSLDLTGNVLAGNINSNALVTAANIQVTGNILTNNITANVDVTATGNLKGNNANITNLLEVGGNANIVGTINGNIANFSGNLTSLNANLGNLATANYVNVATQINGNIANFSGNLTAANANLGNLVTANYANITNNLVVSGNANVTSNVNVTANVTANNITSNNRVTATNIKIGNSYIYANTVTTLTTTPTEICSFMITNTDVYGIEYIVKSFDSTTGASKYSMSTVQAVTNGLDVDYTTYATVRLGNTTGQLSVTRSAVGSDVSINLIATPSSGNSTTWTTQYRLI